MIDLLYQLDEVLAFFYKYYIYHGLLGAVVLCCLIQGKAARGLLWIAATLFGYAGAIKLFIYFLPPKIDGDNFIIPLLFNLFHIVVKVLLIWLCAIFLKRQPSFHLQLTLAMVIIMVLLNVSYVLEMFFPSISSSNFYGYIPLMTLLDLLMLLPLIGGVISGFIKPKYQLKTVHEQGGVS